MLTLNPELVRLGKTSCAPESEPGPEPEPAPPKARIGIGFRVEGLGFRVYGVRVDDRV